MTILIPCPECGGNIGHYGGCGRSELVSEGPDLLEMAENVFSLLQSQEFTAGDAREVLALVAARIQEREARAAL